MSSMSSLSDIARKKIHDRNLIRKESGLPLLQVEAEVRRLVDVEEEAEFERYFEAERHRYSHLWTNSSRGFWSKMAIYNNVRRTLRHEMKVAARSDSDGCITDER